MPQARNIHLGHDGATIPDGFYVRDNTHRLVSTMHAQGAWQPGEQHLAPASALLLAEIEHRLPTDKLISRVTFDVFGVIHSGPFTIDVDVIRPGRTIELVQATMRHDDRITMQARAWRLSASDTTRVAGLEWDAMPPPDSMPKLAFSSIWDGGFIQSIEVRQEATARPGRGRSWLHTDYPLVAGENDPPVAAFVKLVDTANGLVVRTPPGSAFFANVDLSIHFSRQPEGGWTGFDTRVNFGPNGLGETFSVLHDVHGPVGTACQSLTLRLPAKEA